MIVHSKYLTILITLLIIEIITCYQCIHDEYSQIHSQNKLFYNDLSENRLLQQGQQGKIRIFVDYSHLKLGNTSQINTIKRIMNITASYFYNTIRLVRLPRLYFPANQSNKCSLLTVPNIYVTSGVTGDIGVLCGNQNIPDNRVVAKSTSCAYLQSNKRPIWSIIMFNNAYLRYDQEGFQQVLFVGIHQMTHILGFSAQLYSTFPKGNPLVKDQNNLYYLSSPEIQKHIRQHYGCQNSKGLPLQDQDGVQISSHWQNKAIGVQFMGATVRKNSFISNFTLALLDSTGWYTAVNYLGSEPMTWGKNKGCDFLNINNCNFDEFCNSEGFGCDHDATGIGLCTQDLFLGSCKAYKYYLNTNCIDQNFEIKNPNSKLNALERGGSSSRCFQSNLRSPGLQTNKLNNRCYNYMCSPSGKSLYVMVGSTILVCIKEGQVLNGPVGLQGTLKCPSKFDNYCQSKKTCLYHCNKNGACINGKCLCSGQLKLSQTCIDVSIQKQVIGLTGGFDRAKTNNLTNFEFNQSSFSLPSPPPQGEILDITIQADRIQVTPTQVVQVKKYSLDSKCVEGLAFDRTFGECLTCQQIYGCSQCNDNGCVNLPSK